MKALLLAAFAFAIVQPAMAGPLSDAKLIQATLPVHDLARATTFYRDTLGLKLLFQVPGAAFFDAGGVRLRLEASKTTTPATGELYFDDPGLTRAKALEQQGLKFAGPAETVQRTPKADLKLIEFFDPDGNAIGLLGEVPRP